MQICRRRSQWIDPIRAQAGARNLLGPLLLLAITHFLMTSSSSRQYVSSYSARRTLQARRIFFSCDKCYLFLCTVLHASLALRAYFRSHVRLFIPVFRLLHHPAECNETSALIICGDFHRILSFEEFLNCWLQITFRFVWVRNLEDEVLGKMSWPRKDEINKRLRAKQKSHFSSCIDF